ncbi:hypothetical protein ABVT39_015110 [Epinephelus coioides]
MTRFLPSGPFNNILKANEEMKEKLSKEIKEMKIKKFNRDKQDAREGNIYHWRNPERSPKRRPAGHQQTDQFSSDQLSSASSSSFLSNRAREQPGMSIRRKGRGKEKAVHDVERREKPWTRSRAHQWKK